ncbi:MAG: molecular chaperone DnaK [Myxococcales bacterium]|nr:molecular chaperone DnaK [Myxococcales bacterium]
MPERDPVIGIDLGTTNSVVATVQGNQPVVIKNRTGHNLTPSVVAFSKTGKRLVGQIAKRQAITNAQDTVYASKRLLGRKFSSTQVQEAMKHLSYQIVCGEHDDIRVRLGGRDISLPEISAMILAELKQDAEAYFNQPVAKAVVTVPAYFNDGQRQATKDAGKIAGLEVLRIINEPTAAALAYGFGKTVNGKIAVYDLGGGTFDASVLEVGSGVFDVVATGGDSYLGGEDFDNRIIEWLVFGFAKEHGVDLRKDRMALQRLKDGAEKAKIELSTVKEAQINLPFICTPPGGGAALHLQRALTRDKLEELTADLCDRTLSIAEQVLAEAKVKPADLKEIILVGGMTRMPKVVEAVKRYFKREPCKGVHPDEVVALGAAVQANALTSEEAQVLLLDVTPQSLGVAIAGGYTRRLIPKNTTVPTSVSEAFNTSKDNQTSVKIMVLQGENEVAHQNELLGEFVLTGLRQAKRGEVEIEVTFEINSDGIVSVSAKDRETGQRQSITVTASGGLTEEELKRIMEEQGDYLLEAKMGDELKAKRAELEALINEVGQLLPRVQKITDGSEFGVDAVAKAVKHVEAGKRALEGGALSAVTEAHDQLSRTLNLFRGVVQRIGSVR